MKKKFLSIILVLSMLCAFIPVIATAETSDTCGDNLTWTLDDNGTLTISGTGDMKDYGYSDSPFYNNSNIKSVIIENGAINIGNYAFQNCSSLTSVTIPDSVTSIGSFAFSYCSGLMSITIPDSVASIGSSVFNYCSGLTSITIPDSVTNISSHTFYYCKSLTSVTIPNSVTSIGYMAFDGCYKLTDIYYNGTLEEYNKISIEKENTYLQTVTLHCTDNTYLGRGTCGDNLVWILDEGGTLIISGTGDMKNYTDSSTSWNNHQSEIKTVIIEDGVTSIGSSAFTRCSNMTSIIIPDSVTSIGDYAFHYCYSLTSVTIPNSVTSIEYGAFATSGGLKTVVYQGNKEQWSNISINSYNTYLTKANIIYGKRYSTDNGAIYYLDNEITAYIGTDTEIEIPAQIDGEAITVIGENVFKNCANLANVTIPSNIMSIGSSAFDGCSGLKTVCYQGKKEQWSNISIRSNNTYLTNADFVYGKAYNTPNGIMRYANGEILSYSGTDTEMEIPSEINGEKITAIGEGVFKNCTSLVNVVIPDSIEYIETNAFEGTAFWNKADAIYAGTNLLIANPNNIGETYTIKDGTTSIQDNAFKNCESLITINMPESLTSIGNNAFEGCIWLTNVNMPSNVKSIGNSVFKGCKWLNNITIGAGVESIGELAFANCSGLTSITLPANLKSIGELAFESCNRLSGVYINDLAAWCGIDFKTESSNPLSIAGNLYVDGNKVIELTIPDGVMFISDLAFYGGKGFTSVSIPDSVETIGSGAFYNCTNINRVEIGKGLKSVDTYAFNNCNRLSAVYISDLNKWYGIEFADEYSNPLGYAHYLYLNGKSVTELTIPYSVENIGAYAFYGLYGDGDITIENNLFKTVSIGTKAFANMAGIKYITIPDSVKDISLDAFNDSNIIRKNVVSSGIDISGANVSDINSVMYSGTAQKPAVVVNIGGKTLKENTDYKVWYYNNVNIGTAKILITGIGDYTGYVEKTFNISQIASLVSTVKIGDSATIYKGSSLTFTLNNTVGDFKDCIIYHNGNEVKIFTSNNVIYKFSEAGDYDVTCHTTGTETSFVYGQGYVTHKWTNTYTSKIYVIDPNAPVPEPSEKVSKINITGFESAGRDKICVYAEVYPTISAQQEIRFRSTDSSVASVDQYGVVTIKKPGTAQIVVENVEGISATVDLDLQPLDISKAQIISLSQSDDGVYTATVKDKYGVLTNGTDYNFKSTIDGDIITLEAEGIGLYSGKLVEKHNMQSGEKIYPTPTATPTPSPSAEPTASPTPSPSATPINTPTPSPSSQPTETDEPIIKPTPTVGPIPIPKPCFTVDLQDTYADVTNVGGEQTVTVIIAQYDGNVLQSVKAEIITFAEDEKRTFDFADGIYKVFVWNSLSGMLQMTK